jgi:hypothetical protein
MSKAASFLLLLLLSAGPASAQTQSAGKANDASAAANGNGKGNSWTSATVQAESSVKGDRAHVVVLLSDGQGKQERRELDLPVEDATLPRITALLREGNKVEVAKNDVVAAGTVIDLSQTTPSTVVKTPKVLWKTKRDQYRRLKADIDAGLTVEQSAADTLLADLIRTYDDSYVLD